MSGVERLRPTSGLHRPIRPEMEARGRPGGSAVKRDHVGRCKLPVCHRGDGASLSLVASGWSPPRQVSDILGGVLARLSDAITRGRVNTPAMPFSTISGISGASALLRVLNVSGLQARPRPSGLIRLKAAPPADLRRHLYHFWGVGKVFLFLAEPQKQGSF